MRLFAVTLCFIAAGLSCSTTTQNGQDVGNAYDAGADFQAKDKGATSDQTQIGSDAQLVKSDSGAASDANTGDLSGKPIDSTIGQDSFVPIGPTYYVATSGNDNNAGTKVAPWRTISHAADMLKAGDTVLIRGGTYAEQIMGGASGTANAYITYAGYPGEQAILQGTTSYSDWKLHSGKIWRHAHNTDMGSQFYALEGTHKRLEDAGSVAAMTAGSVYYDGNAHMVYVWTTGGVNPNSAVTIDVALYDFAFNGGNRWGGTSKNYIRLKDLVLQKYASTAISTAYNDEPNNNHHWEIDRVTVRYIQSEGIFCAMNHWHLHDSLFYHNRGHGAQIIGNNTIFEKNESYENEHYGPYYSVGCGVLIGSNPGCHSNVVRNNYLHDNGDPNGYGAGVYIETYAHDNVVENNLIANNGAGGVTFAGGNKNIVRNNIIVQTKSAAWSMNGILLTNAYEQAPEPATGNIVINNTFVGLGIGVAITEPQRGGGANVNNVIRNNIFFQSAYEEFNIQDTTSVVDHNLWFVPTGNYRFHYQNTTHTTLSAYQSGSGKGQGDKTTNPLFNNAAAQNFHLKSGSPAINAGSSTQAPLKDYDNKTRSGNPDIGAFEF